MSLYELYAYKIYKVKFLASALRSDRSSGAVIMGKKRGPTVLNGCTTSLAIKTEIKDQGQGRVAIAQTSKKPGIHQSRIEKQRGFSCDR